MPPAQGARNLSPTVPPHRDGKYQVVVSPLRLRASHTSHPVLPSASEELAEELREAESKLHALEKSLGGLRRAATKKRTHLQETKERQNRELAYEEESASSLWHRHGAEVSVGSKICRDLASEKESLHEKVQQAELRAPLVEAALSSDLYWRWKGMFEAYLRAGGRFDDFSMDDFLTEFYGVTKAVNLDTPLNETERYVAEYSTHVERFGEVSSVETQLRSELATLRPDISDLKDELKQLEETNFLWLQGNLADKPRANELRGEKNRLGIAHCELEAELNDLRRRKAHAEDFLWHHKAEADAIRARFMPCEQLVGELEQTFEITESHGERIKQTIEMKEYELDESQLVRTWKREIKRLDYEGPELQQEALSFLQEAAVEVQCRDMHKEEMDELRADLQECQHEAMQLSKANQYTNNLLASTTEDLYGLEIRHDQLVTATERGASLLERAVATASPQSPVACSLDGRSDKPSSPSPRLQPMDRAKALALARGIDRSDDSFDGIAINTDLVGAGAIAFAARAAHANTVPRPLPMVGRTSSIGSPQPRPNASPMRFQSTFAPVSRHGSAALTSTGSKRFNAI